MIGNLQLLRGLAALGVVFYHTDFRILGAHTDFMGVAIFFVISGFLMVHVTRDDATGFFVKRVVRIVPFYWLMTLVAWIVITLGMLNIPPIIQNPVKQLREYAYGLVHMDWSVQLPALAKSLLFIPTGSHPVLSVGWTLNIEMFFYALFALALLGGRTLAPIISACVLTILFFVNRSGDYGPIVATYGHDYVAFFVFGIGLYYLLPLVSKLRNVSLVLGVAALGWWPYACVLQTTSHATHYLVPPSVVLALLAIEKANVRVTDKWLLLFGGASYSLYLSHPLVLEAIRTLLPISEPAGMAIAVGLSCAVAVGLYLWVELPLIASCRERVTIGRISQPQPAQP